MSRFAVRAMIVLIALASLLAGSIGGAQADVIVTRPFAGVTHYHETRTTPDALSIHVVKVNLRDPGVSIRVTDPVSPDSNLTALRTTSQFVTDVGAQIGINANFFNVPNLLQPLADPVGLVASNGNIYSPFLAGRAAVAFDADNFARFLDSAPTDTSNIVNAVAGLQRLIRDGQITDEGNDPALQPRSALGLTARNELLLVAVDGRNPGHSVGMTTAELAQLLLGHGAVDAINLDGGGSTTLVMADGINNAARVVNIPSGLSLPDGTVLLPPGTERPVGVNLGIFATAVPEPGTLTLTLIGLGALLVRRAVVTRERR